MFPIGNNEGMHRSAGLQARHRGTFPECLPGLDGHEILAAVHNLVHDVSGAEIHVLQFRGKTHMYSGRYPFSVPVIPVHFWGVKTDYLLRS